MPKFAPVCSLRMLKQLDDVGILGDYHLLLAHKVLKQPLEWSAFFRKQNKFLGVKPFIIMDNSLIELGYPLEAQQLADAATAVNADVVVLPDVLQDRHQTVDLSVSAMEQLQGKISDKVALMGVVQGNSREEYIDCAFDLITYAHVEFLAIPRITVEVLGSRIYISTDIVETFQKPVHLLGFSDNIADDICSVICTPQCLGIDSSIPLRLGCCEGKLLDQVGTLTHNIIGNRPSDWLDDTNEFELTYEAIDNVKRFRRIIS